jgi:hypothetical protein
MRVGHRWLDGTIELYFQSDADQRDFRNKYGTENIADIWPLLRMNQYGSIFAPLQNPKLVWAGKGGYWSEADINQFV